MTYLLNIACRGSGLTLLWGKKEIYTYIAYTYTHIREPHIHKPPSAQSLRQICLPCGGSEKNKPTFFVQICRWWGGFGFCELFSRTFLAYFSERVLCIVGFSFAPLWGLCKEVNSARVPSIYSGWLFEDVRNHARRMFRGSWPKRIYLFHYHKNLSCIKRKASVSHKKAPLFSPRTAAKKDWLILSAKTSVYLRQIYQSRRKYIWRRRKYIWRQQIYQSRRKRGSAKINIP